MQTVEKQAIKTEADDLTELSEDLAQDSFDDDQIAQIAGWDEMEEQSENDLLTPEDRLNLIEHRATSTKPMPRLIIAGGISAVVALFFLLLAGGKSGQQQNQPLVVSNPASGLTPGVIKDPAQAQQIEDLKTRQALDQQNQKGQPIQLKPPTKPPTKTVPQASVVRPVFRSAAIPQTRPLLASAPPVQSVPFRSAPFRPVLSGYRPQPYTAPAPQEDPASAIKRLTELGVVLDGSNSSSSSSSASTASLNAGYQNASYVQEDSAIASDYPSALNTDTSAIDAASIAVQEGTTAKASLQTPIVWNSEIDISNRHFKAILSQAFGGIPKGAIATLQPDPAQTSRQSGVLQLIVASFQVNGTDHPVTDGIDVVASDNAPVQAKLIRPGTGFGVRDVIGFVAGTAQTAIGGSSLVGSNTDFGSQVAINAGNNVIGRVQQSTATQPSLDRSYFKFSGSIKLIANQNLSL